MKFKLLSLDRAIPSFDMTLDGSPIRIGRRAGSDIQLDDESVSDYHCKIDQINGTLWIRDLGSAKGIFVNGFNVTQSHLMPGDRLTVGTTSFRVEYERATQGQSASRAVEFAEAS
jgi:pSer/pThr/pTyr-binding forkhead associated (FHA) protein